MRARAIYACVAENAGEVTFDADDWLGAVTDSSEDGWLVGTVETTGDRGLFPVVYTELVPETGDDMRFLQKLQSSGLLSSTLKLEQFSRDLNSSTRPRPPPPPPPTAVSLGRQAAAPPVSTKPLFNQVPRPARPLAPKPTTKPVMKPKSEPKSEPLPSVHQNHQPVLPPKPINIDSSDPELRRQKEREAAELWESKFGIGAASAARSKEVPQPPPVAAKPVILSKPAVATKPVIMSKPATVATTPHKPVPTLAPKPTLKPKPGFNPQSEFRNSHPSTENDAPVLPFSSARSAAQERLAQQQRDAQIPVSNPALENTPPTLPYSPSRRVIAEPLVAPVESAIQPNPRQLIAQLNGSGNGTPARAAAHRNFEDNFDPRAHTPASNSSTPPITHNGGGGGIPLTAAREVKGTRPLVSATPSRSTVSIASMAQRQPVLPPKPAKQQLGVSRSVSFASHSGYVPPTDSATNSSNSPSLLSPALSFTSSGGFQSPLTTAIHRSSAKSDAIPADALARYSHLFKRLDKQHGKRGFLNADEVHAVVIRCRLPDDLLRRIWALSDRNLNGKFGPGEFYIIMHLTDCALRQEPIPEILSVDLLRSAYPD
ncbi:hypothetical protein GGI09_003468 [Coemansia sp. S100]|nr:hypothetical protein LPJ71_002358 [Coemansia sp. S17]KAJ2098141.1 hypothetical protein GGI09_003468 [Coemansia sp. S100]KAJ2103365.1 hypothetical protein GGI16_002997 [Coemansia sp. S142-1]